MELYDEYVEYMEELAPEAETWVQEQIAEELYTRDNSIKSLRARITELQERGRMSHIEDLALEIDYLRGDLAKRDAEIERLRERIDSLEDSLSNSVNAEWHNEEIAWLQEQNTMLAERIGCGCGGDFGICNECTAALTGKRA